MSIYPFGRRDARKVLDSARRISGVRRRYETASRHLPEFGVAMYCGFGRQPGADGRETMRKHREAVLALR